MVQEGVDRVGRDVASPLVGEVFQNARVEVVELAARLGAVRLPPVVRELRERHGIERASRKVNAHRDFGFSLGEDVVSDLR
jgi:hypothetical protein